MLFITLWRLYFHYRIFCPSSLLSVKICYFQVFIFTFVNIFVVYLREGRLVEGIVVRSFSYYPHFCHRLGGHDVEGKGTQRSRLLVIYAIKIPFLIIFFLPPSGFLGLVFNVYNCNVILFALRRRKRIFTLNNYMFFTIGKLVNFHFQRVL